MSNINFPARERSSRHGLTHFPTSCEVLTTTIWFEGELAAGGEIYKLLLPTNAMVVRASVMIQGVENPPGLDWISWSQFGFSENAQHLHIYGLTDQTGVESPVPYKGWMIADYILSAYAPGLVDGSGNTVGMMPDAGA